MLQEKRLLKVNVKLPVDLYQGCMPVEAYKACVPVRETVVYLDPSELNGESPYKRAVRWAFFAPGNRNSGLFYKIMGEGQKKGNLFFEDYATIEEVPRNIGKMAKEIAESVQPFLRNIEVSSAAAGELQPVLESVKNIGDAAVRHVVEGARPNLERLRKYFDDDGRISNILTDEEERLYSGKPQSKLSGIKVPYKPDKRPKAKSLKQPTLFAQPKRGMTEEEMSAVFQKDTDRFNELKLRQAGLSEREYRMTSMAETIDFELRAKGVATDLKPLSHEIEDDFKPPEKKKVRYWKNFVFLRSGRGKVTLIYEKGSTRKKRLEGMKRIKNQTWKTLETMETEARENGKIGFYYCPDDVHYGPVILD